MKSVPLAAAGREGSKLRTRASSPCDSTAITAHKPPEQESVSIFDSSFILLPDRHGNCRLSVSRRVPTDLRSDVTFLSDGAVNAFGIVEEHLSKTHRDVASAAVSVGLLCSLVLQIQSELIMMHMLLQHLRSVTGCRVRDWLKGVWPVIWNGCCKVSACRHLEDQGG